MTFFLTKFISICSLFSYASACIHYCLISAGLSRAPLNISGQRRHVFTDLIQVWRARIVRRIISVLVRSPLRRPILSLVNLEIPVPADSGCVIAICHTPWKRLLVQWCLENNFAFVISNGIWTHQRKCIQKQGKGISDLREIIKYLQEHGRIILTFDNFNKLNNCPVKFLGSRCNVSMFPARLARIAGVPLITAVPTLCDGTIQIKYGPRFDADNINANPENVMKNIIRFLEAEIKNNPGIWPAVPYRSFV